MPQLTINFQILSKSFAPKNSLFKKWVTLALPRNKNAELTIRIVNCKESQSLNKKYRNKNYPTNVLSFSYIDNLGVSVYLGDLVICAPIVTKEAQTQKKLLLNHWAHLTIHGVLHLLGYDHLTEPQAKTMEALEVKLLKKLDIENPY